MLLLLPRYRDALAHMTDAHGNFATALAEFGCGSDEDSLIMGKPHSQTPTCMLVPGVGSFFIMIYDRSKFC